MSHRLSCLVILLLLAGIVLAAPGVPGAQTNVLTVWEDANATQGTALTVPKDDPSRTFVGKREVERGRLETAIYNAQSDLLQVQDYERRQRMLIVLEELERRLRMLNSNPNKYFALYPYQLPTAE